MKLNLGCGGRAVAGYTNVDAYYTVAQLKKLNSNVKNAKYVKADITKLPFKDSSADIIENTDVIEHLKMQAVVPALKEWFRVLKPGGELVLTTNDFNGIVREWARQITGQPFNLEIYHNWFEVIYGTEENDGQYHKTPFTPEFMDLCLTLAGFGKRKITVIPQGEKCPPEYRERPGKDDRVLRNDMLVVHAWKPKV